jgi:hypothetical protein
MDLLGRAWGRSISARVATLPLAASTPIPELLEHNRNEVAFSYN